MSCSEPDTDVGGWSTTRMHVPKKKPVRLRWRVEATHVSSFRNIANLCSMPPPFPPNTAASSTPGLAAPPRDTATIVPATAPSNDMQEVGDASARSDQLAFRISSTLSCAFSAFFCALDLLVRAGDGDRPDEVALSRVVALRAILAPNGVFTRSASAVERRIIGVGSRREDGVMAVLARFSGLRRVGVLSTSILSSSSPSTILSWLPPDPPLRGEGAGGKAVYEFARAVAVLGIVGNLVCGGLGSPDRSTVT